MKVALVLEGLTHMLQESCRLSSDDQVFIYIYIHIYIYIYRYIDI